MFNPNFNPAPGSSSHSYHPIPGQRQTEDPGGTEPSQPLHPQHGEGGSPSGAIVRRHPRASESGMRTRLMQAAEEGRANSAADTYIQPNRTTRPGGSWGCELRAAAMEGTALRFMGNDDVEAVCIRLLQAVHSSDSFRKAAATEVFFGLAGLYMLAFKDASAFPKAVFASDVLVAAAAAPAHARISIQYASVARQCQTYLAERFGQSFVDELKGLRLDKKGINRLIDLLITKNPEIETLKLDEQLKKLDEQQADQWVLGSLQYFFEGMAPKLHLEP